MNIPNVKLNKSNHEYFFVSRDSTFFTCFSYFHTETINPAKMNRFLAASCLLLVFHAVVVVHGQNNRLRERFGWRSLSFQFPDDRTRQSLINSQEYVPLNNVPLGIEIYRDRFFVTVPRWRPGIASTLNYFRFSSKLTKSLFNRQANNLYLSIIVS